RNSISLFLFLHEEAYALQSLVRGCWLSDCIICRVNSPIHRKLKVSSHGHDSCLGKAAYQSSQCYLSCIEWTIKSVNRNAYIMAKVSSIATDLITNNILKIGRLKVSGDVILLLGKLCVSLSSALSAFLMLDTHKYR
ncbi:Choline transporter protein 1, partial [Mucuna pruriens]